MARIGARLLLACITATAVAVGPLTAPELAVASPKDPALAKKLSSVLRDSRVQRARTGTIVLDARDGTELYTRYAARSTTPASNTKILTAVAALDTLGPNYRFKTTVISRAAVQGGVIKGRLYLKGYGDPTTRQSDFASLARQVRAKGVRRVTGSLAVDASHFDSQRYNPNWSTAYHTAYYAGQISALTVAPNADFDSGTILIAYRPGARGKRAKISVYPAAAAKYVRIVNRTTTPARGSYRSFSATRRYGSNTITVSGRVPVGSAGGGRLITVHRPELLAAKVFRAELAKVGVTVAGPTKAVTTPASGRRTLATDYSMRLSALLVPFMKYSNNMHAEHLTKAMGARGPGAGSWSRGLAYTRASMRKFGAPMGGVVLVDGSGLTRRNKVTARAMARVLFRVQRESWFGAFYNSLPIAGVANRVKGGTLRYRMNGTRADGNARAKTGTLTGVTALSGYVRGRDGRRYVFSMISEHSGASPRPVENTFVVALANWRR